MPSTQEQFLQALESNERNSLQNYLGVQVQHYSLLYLAYKHLCPVKLRLFGVGKRARSARIRVLGTPSIVTSKAPYPTLRRTQEKGNKGAGLEHPRLSA